MSEFVQMVKFLQATMGAFAATARMTIHAHHLQPSLPAARHPRESWIAADGQMTRAMLESAKAMAMQARCIQT
jgi:hypothetical protein